MRPHALELGDAAVGRQVREEEEDDGGEDERRRLIRDRGHPHDGGLVRRSRHCILTGPEKNESSEE